jgi:hypothetical protein
MREVDRNRRILANCNTPLTIMESSSMHKNNTEAAHLNTIGQMNLTNI